LWSEKKDGSKRVCADFRQLNKITKQTLYPLPLIDDILTLLGSSKYFTTLDMRSGFWQIPLPESDTEKTALTTFKRLYEYNMVPFGLVSAP
jgi:putative transposase